MTMLLCLVIVLCVSVLMPAESIGTNTTEGPRNGSEVTKQNAIASGGMTTISPNGTGEAAPTSQTPGGGLSTLAFGVMSFILILIIVMVILVTVVNLRGRCSNTKENELKNYGSVISEGQKRHSGVRESIMLVSMRTFNSDTDTDSVRLSSIFNIAPDSEY